MNTLTLDYESYYANDYSLTKLSTLEYIRHPQFLLHGAAVKFNDGKAYWVDGEDLAAFFSCIDWAKTALITHNYLFDGTITHEKFGVEPAWRIDTLSLCRALLSHDLNFDLGSIGQYLQLGQKGSDLILTKGLRELPPDLRDKLAAYSIQDVELAYGIYQKLYHLLPADEQAVMNITLRMSCEGVLQFDEVLARESQAEITERRQQLLGVIGMTEPSSLRSREKFAQLLRNKGVEPPTKKSLTTGKTTYAFSKQDPQFVLLKEHPEVAALVEAKLAWSSNSEITRLERLINITNAEPHTLPVQLNYAGAHTARFSGGGGINTQSLQRGSKLRKAILAPPGQVIVVADSSQIELRMNAWFCGQDDITELLTPGEYVFGDAKIEWKGGDVYRKAASVHFDKPPEEITKAERQFGKLLTLGLGYGMGKDKFRATCAIGAMGMAPLLLTVEEAERAVATYRRSNTAIADAWRTLQSQVIPRMTQENTHYEYGPLVIGPEQITRPNGLSLLYPNLQATEAGEYLWGLNDRVHRFYGGIALENIIQSLASDVVRGYMLEIDRDLQGIGQVVHQVHDEILIVCPEREADGVLKYVVTEVMSRAPAWATGLPLRAEGGYDYCYSK